MVNLAGVHHVAYRCKDAKETAQWYKDVLGMDLILSIAENEVPSTKEPDPYMHIFLNAGRENVLAFFEIPNSPDMGRDENTPAWVQHLAIKVDTVEDLLEAKKHIESKGVEVLGPTDHTIFKSIYFFDPNGHRLELATNTGTPEQYKKLNGVAQIMLDEWAETKLAPNHAAWLHNKDE